jgi:hypothetical protein
MRRYELVAVAALLVSCIAVSGLLLYIKEGGPPGAQSAVITSANVSGKADSASMTVENTGTASLVGLGVISVSPGESGSCYGWTWTPNPATTYPVYTGESVSGSCYLLSGNYRPGLSVTVSVVATFSDGHTSVLSAAVTVG